MSPFPQKLLGKHLQHYWKWISTMVLSWRFIQKIIYAENRQRAVFYFSDIKFQLFCYLRRQLLTKAWKNTNSEYTFVWKFSQVKLQSGGRPAATTVGYYDILFYNWKLEIRLKEEKGERGKAGILQRRRSGNITLSYTIGESKLSCLLQKLVALQLIFIDIWIHEVDHL